MLRFPRRQKSSVLSSRTGMESPRGCFTWIGSIQSEGGGMRAACFGINPPGGENRVPRKSWAGDHVEAGIADVQHASYKSAS